MYKLRCYCPIIFPRSRPSEGICGQLNQSYGFRHNSLGGGRWGKSLKDKYKQKMNRIIDILRLGIFKSTSTSKYFEMNGWEWSLNNKTESFCIVTFCVVMLGEPRPRCFDSFKCNRLYDYTSTKPTIQPCNLKTNSITVWFQIDVSRSETISFLHKTDDCDTALSALSKTGSVWNRDFFLDCDR